MKNAYTIPGFLSIAVLLLWSPPSPDTHQIKAGIAVYHINRIASHSLKEEIFKKMYGGNVQVNKLYRDQGSYGYAIWLKRSSKKIKAKYFASSDINTKYEGWQENKNIVMLCSGAFTTSDFGKPLPVGLTVDNGKTVNKMVNHQMDGLVIVYASGGIAVSDIDEGNLYLKTLGRSVDARDDWDKYELLEWAENQKATIFQTQLLAYKNKLRLDVHKARKEHRERRILVLAKDVEGTLFHIIFDIEEGAYLGELAQDLLNYLRQKEMNVIAMLNLDTGWYDFLKVFDKEKDLVLKRNPDKSPTNLLVYHYSE